MHDTPRRFARQTAAAFVALSLVLSVLGPVGTVAAQPSVTVTQSADATTVAPGDSVTLTTEFGVAELNAPQLSATTPDGWAIVSQSAEGPAAYNDEGTWQWLAGDDDGVNVSYTVEYTVSVPEDAATGDYTVAADGSALSPSDSSETADTASTTITVQEEPANEGPTAAFDATPSPAEVGGQVSFDASASGDADGSIASYEWAFGDGDTATGESATHSYDAPGEYAVTLTVTDDDGATDTATQTVSVTEPSDPGTQPSTAVSLSPSEDLVAVNGSTTFDVVVEDADGGVGAYSLSVSLSDGAAASVTNVSVDGDALADVQVADDGSTASVDAALLDTEQNGSVTVATVTVAGDAEGSSDVELDVASLGTESGSAYGVTGTSGAALSVSELVVGPSEQPAQDPDGDGTYQDVNGDGVIDELDVQVLFGARNSQVVQTSPGAFDFNGDGDFDILDVQALYHGQVA